MRVQLLDVDEAERNNNNVVEAKMEEDEEGACKIRLKVKSVE